MSEIEAAMQTLAQKDRIISSLKVTNRKLREEIERLNITIKLERKAHVREITELKSIKMGESNPEDLHTLLLVLFSHIYGVPVEDIRSESRKRPIPQIRFSIGHYLVTSYPLVALKKLAKIMGYKDHTSMIHARDRVNEWFDMPVMYREELASYNKVKKHIENMIQTGEIKI
jgi:chromosomal replication initiation ATPase DnaA